MAEVRLGASGGSFADVGVGGGNPESLGGDRADAGILEDGDDDRLDFGM